MRRCGGAHPTRTSASRWVVSTAFRCAERWASCKPRARCWRFRQRRSTATERRPTGSLTSHWSKTNNALTSHCSKPNHRLFRNEQAACSEVNNHPLLENLEEHSVGKKPPHATPLRVPPSRFDEFWAAYPRRRDKRKAEKAFAAARKRTDADTIIDGAHRYAADPNRIEQFTKYAEGWLNGDGWLDEPLPPRHGHRPPQSTADLRVAQAQALKHRPPQRLEIE